MDAYLDGLLDEIVAVEPRVAWDDVLRRAGSRRVTGSRRVVVGGLVAATALIAGGIATARATGLLDSGPLHRATVYENPTTLVGTGGQVSTCELIGKPAGRVEATLASNGIGIEWRFQHWGDVVVTNGGGSPGAVSGGRSDAVASVPGDSIVWDAIPDDRSPNTAFIFVQSPNDPNAPTISVTGCS